MIRNEAFINFIQKKILYEVVLYQNLTITTTSRNQNKNKYKFNLFPKKKYWRIFAQLKTYGEFSSKFEHLEIIFHAFKKPIPIVQ